MFRHHLSIILCFLTAFSFAQQNHKYLVIFTDKDGVEFNPHSYFDAKAIERRQQHGYSLDHITDKPVRQDYISSLSLLVDSTGRALRWHNGVVVFTDLNNIDQIKNLPHVRKVLKFGESKAELAGVDLEFTQGQLKLAKAQIKRMQGDLFRKAGLTGEGMRIAILDAGFPGVDYLQAFEHIRHKKKIIAHRDFIKNKDNTYKGHTHGTMVLSNIAGMVDGIPLGMATDAEFLLARTENVFSEGLSDEENWLAAMEWADKNGAQLINSSLGYTKRLYFRKDMDGVSALVTRTGNLAASKGILVVNSAGNEGDDVDWRTIGAPADADSVLAVGAINPWTNIQASWSSYGPSADKRLKPNVSAFGYAMVMSKNSLQMVTGTSFASPLTCGFAACAWQANRSRTVMELFRALESSGELHPYYDYAHGYGVPQASYFFDTIPKRPISDPLIVSYDSSQFKVNIESVMFSRASLPMLNYYGSKHSLDFNHPHGNEVLNTEGEAFLHYGDSHFSTSSSGIFSNSPDYFFYSIGSPGSYLDIYYVIGVENQTVLDIPIDDSLKGKILRMHYKGYTKEVKL